MRTGRAVAFAALAAVTVGCTRSGNASPRQAASSGLGLDRLLTTRVAGEPARQMFSGWDSQFGSFAFTLAWTISATGRIDGELQYVETSAHGLRRTTSHVTGIAGPTSPKTHRSTIDIALSPAVRSVASMSGSADAGHVFLQPPDDSSQELFLYGSSAAAASEFRRHLAMISGPGGYAGWLRRRATAHAAVRRIDMDGDGQRDLVVVVWKRLVNPFIGGGTREVLVHFAAGGSASISVGAVNTGDQSAPVGLTSVVHLPGLAGRQLVLTWDIGAANTFYRVVAAINGRLVSVPTPSGQVWGYGGTVGTGVTGQFCRGGTVSFYSERYVDNDGAKQRLQLSTYFWRDGWVLVSRVDRIVSARELERLVPTSAWNCG